jgi:hypothetical protein
MILEMKSAKTEIHSGGVIPQPARMKMRSLGWAIFLAAIADYRSKDEQEHKNAERFLYPKTREWQNHYDWAVALAEGLNPGWLRDSLDRDKAKWDGERASKTRRAPTSCLKFARKDRPNEKQRTERTHRNGLRVPGKHARSFNPAVQPASEACSARPADAAPGL